MKVPPLRRTTLNYVNRRVQIVNYRLVFFLLLFSIGAQAQTSAGILAPSRAIDWSQAGVPGGIPSASWTQCGSTIAAGASAATITAAVQACPPNHYVLLG